MSDVALSEPALAAPRVGTIPLVVAGLIFVALLAAPFWGNGFVTALLVRGMLLAIAAISLDLLVGRGGLVSLGHAAFIAIGAYATGIGLEEGISNGLVLLALALGAAALFALVTGAISLRTHGVGFIMITLAFGQMAFFTFSSLSAYGGDDGLTLWNGPDLFGTDWLTNRGGLYFVILAALVLVWWLVARIARSRFGRVLTAAKDNPVRVSTMGYDVNRVRLVAYVIAGTIAGLAGFLSACHAEFVSPASAAWQHSGELLVVVVLGGIATRNGALIGAFALVLLEEALGHFVTDWRLIFGPLLVIITLISTGGILGVFGRIRQIARR